MNHLCVSSLFLIVLDVDFFISNLYLFIFILPNYLNFGKLLKYHKYLRFCIYISNVDVNTTKYKDVAVLAKKYLRTNYVLYII